MTNNRWPWQYFPAHASAQKDHSLGELDRVAILLLGD